MPCQHRRGAAQIEIEKLLIRKSHWDDHGLAHYFDEVAGTSTGEIIAAGIAIQTPVRQIADFYLGSAAATLRRYVFRYQTQASRSHCG